MSKPPNLREVSCCITCKNCRVFYNMDDPEEVTCTKYKYREVEYYNICDDYEPFE